MKQFARLLLLAILFLASIAVGFFLPDWLSKTAERETVGTDPVPEEAIVQEEEVIQPQVQIISQPVYSNGKYVVEVKAEGDDVTLYLADDKMNAIEGSAVHADSHSFSLAPTSSGIYYVYAIDARGTASDYQMISGCETVSVVNKVTASEFQTLLLSKDENSANSKLRGRINNAAVSYRFSGINEDEPRPTSYMEIINRLKMGTWSSLQVTSVGYDSQGRLNSANITVTY